MTSGVMGLTNGLAGKFEAGEGAILYVIVHGDLRSAKGKAISSWL